MRILTEEERQVILNKRPKPPGNIFWEKYLDTLYNDSNRLGETITFARYGEWPPDGQSQCFITLAPPYKSYPKLKGASVFEVVNGFEVYPMGYHKELFTRPRITGRGTIIGWGTDGEPLISILKKF